MHSNSRLLFERRHMFHVVSHAPFAMTRAKSRIKPGKNRTVTTFPEGEFLEATDGRAFSENNPESSNRMRDNREQINEAIFSKKTVACTILKGLILIICISCFLYQSTNFFVLYFTYPTTLSLAVTNPEIIIKPAVTFCSSDLVNRTYFCTEYPNLCNLTEFCEKYPFNCSGNNSDLLIPDTEEGEEDYIVKALETVQHMHLAYIHGERKINPWSLRILGKNRGIKENFIFNQYTGFHSMCYSSNLHLDDEAEPEKWDINSSPREVRNMIDYFTLQMPNNEDFLFESFPKLVFSVHSPFVRDNPHILQNELMFGHSYEINVHLKEEHLLQHPYPTDCTDYDDLWRKNNKTGPRSQEVCKKKCSDAYAQQCWKCTPLWKHLKYNETCIQDYSFCEKMYHEEIPSCEMKCKVNCLKLKYYFTVKDKPDQFESQTVSESSDFVHVFLYMDNTEVEVMKHNRLYGLIREHSIALVLRLPNYTNLNQTYCETEELFSYIGGLMGCWLGISVWASVGIFEKIYWKIVQVQRQLRKK